ncbi:Glutamine--tRNA ligase [Thelohanellus kitauei]|uniref:Glutamine--tRNA ligase n=1 Tax=Thelohanellus kitauei TaxID=669202 RepID=A0A0C2NDK7_THEKT|nr:Glutamine--tRNA ligase [Thelohanellus kitauei]
MIKAFVDVGIKENKAKETARNPALGNRLFSIIKMVDSDNKGYKFKPQQGMLLHTLASHKFNDDQLKLVLKYVTSGEIASGTQIKAASEYFCSNIQSSVDIPLFERACGIGVVYDDADVERAVLEAILKIKFKSGDPQVNRGLIIGHLKIYLGYVYKIYKWVDSSQLHRLIDKHLDKIVSFTEEPVKADEHVIFADWKSVLESIDPLRVYSQGEAAKFHAPGKNYMSPGYVVTEHTERLMAEHLAKYGNVVRLYFLQGKNPFST